MSSPSAKQSRILLRSGNNEVEFIEFNIGDTSYGVNVAKVLRVIAKPSVEVTHGSNDPKSAMMGTIFVLGKPIQLIDLRKALSVEDFEASQVEESRRLILVTKFNRRTTSFLIDSVDKIHRTSWDQFQPIDNLLEGDGAGLYVTGTIKIENRVIVILDLEHLMLDYDQELKALNEPQDVNAPVDLIEQRRAVKIVYAEDSRIIRRMMLKTLREYGYSSVKEFEHGESAHEYLLKEKKEAEAAGAFLSDRIGCIITDIEMPKMDGLTLCKSIKGSGEETEVPAVVVYSSLVNDEMAKKCQSVGADAQISKPHGDEIIDLLDKICLAE